MKKIFIIFLVFATANIDAQSILTKKSKMSDKLEIATLANGCFWCTEAIFQRLNGVEKVTSGYSGGKVKNPTYNEVTSGETGHAEVIQIQFDPKIISFQEILEVFFATHDPTTLNRQGPDIGTQYRSAIFYLDAEQKKIAEQSKTKMNNEKFNGTIVTEITKSSTFYPAEKYHQKYNEKMKKQYGIG